MRIRDRMALVSLIVLSSATTSSAVHYIHGSPIVPRDATLAAPELPSHGSPSRNVGRRADADDTSRETKTLAGILLMLKGGRGAR